MLLNEIKLEKNRIMHKRGIIISKSNFGFVTFNKSLYKCNMADFILFLDSTVMVCIIKINTNVIVIDIPPIKLMPMILIFSKSPWRYPKPCTDPI